MRHFEDFDPMWPIEKEFSSQTRGVVYADHYSDEYQCTHLF